MLDAYAPPRYMSHHHAYAHSCHVDYALPMFDYADVCRRCCYRYVTTLRLRHAATPGQRCQPRCHHVTSPYADDMLIFSLIIDTAAFATYARLISTLPLHVATLLMIDIAAIDADAAFSFIC